MAVQYESPAAASAEGRQLVMETTALHQKSLGTITAARMAALLPSGSTELDKQLDWILGTLPQRLEDMCALLPPECLLVVGPSIHYLVPVSQPGIQHVQLGGSMLSS